ncbi:MAG: Crp/Fnr family transcriptional regulator [Burkholderiaceae bacterium]
MSTPRLTPRSNTLLADMTSARRSSLLKLLTPTALTLGDVLYEAQATIRYIYFPVDCLVSLLAPQADHRPLEVAVVGSEGLVGVALALGMRTSLVKAVVQASGSALRMTAQAFIDELPRQASLHRDIDRYIHSLIAQVTQTAACNAFHSVEARCARWLLMARDRMQTDEIELTQEALAQILGVRRVGVTVAAGNLQRLGIIEYSRGRIVILDRRRLAEAACECYGIVSKVYENDRAAWRARGGRRRALQLEMQ